MSKERLMSFCGKDSIKIVEAMEQIDKNTYGVLFLTDVNKKLIGAVSDGDIRRWLIKTGDLNVQITKLMNRTPFYIYSADKSNAKAFMKKKRIRALPVVDSEMNVLDILLDDDENVERVNGKALIDVPIIIMAGGKGTRLYPYTKILPKPLIPIGDIPILERIIDRFCEYGASEYYMTVNYKKNMIKAHFAELQPDYVIEYVEEDKPLGTGGSIKLIKKKFDVPIVVTNCDILIQADYEDIYSYHKEVGNVMTIVAALKNIEVPYGVLHTGEKGIIKGIEEKPKLSYFVNTGMYIVNPDILEKIPDDTFFHMTDLAGILMKEGLQVGMYPISEESFLDMGEFEEMHRMEEKLNSK